MKSVSISGFRRGNVGKKDAKALRKEGKIPCVLYGGKDQVHFFAENLSFKNLIFTPDVLLIDLDIEGSKHRASLQDVQYHPVTDELLHVDFLEITDGKPIIIGIPTHVVGTSPGILKGGKLITKLRKLKVRALAENLPDKIDIDISSLDILDSFKVHNLTVENLTFLDNPSSVIVSVAATRGVETPVAGGK
jgi:large subunit ribosomal protein L25